MNAEKDIETTGAFYGQLFSKALPIILVVLGVGFLDVWVFDRFASWASRTIILFVALLKIFLIVRLTFNQLGKIIGQSHLLSHVLVLFALLIGIIVLSFATDYTALYLVDSDNFKVTLNNGNSKLILLYEFFYFSLISFSSVGFGDIVPITITGKFLVMLEIFLSFFVLVFGIANINRIHVEDIKKGNS